MRMRAHVEWAGDIRAIALCLVGHSIHVLHGILALLRFRVLQSLVLVLQSVQVSSILFKLLL